MALAVTVVAGDHAYLHAGLLGAGNRVLRLRPRRVLDAHERQKCEAVDKGSRSTLASNVRRSKSL